MSRKIKKTILAALQEPDWPNVQMVLDQYDSKSLVNHLFTALCSTNELQKWNSVLSFGYLLNRIAGEKIEDARIIMRRFLWSLNDESGGIGWGAPEAMAECMSCNDILFKEYSHMLISYMREDGPELLQDGNYLEYPYLQRGLLWGIARLFFSRKKEMQSYNLQEDILPYLDSEDAIVRGMALFTCAQAEIRVPEKRLESIIEQPCDFSIYWNDRIQDYSTQVLVASL